jgi:hypothetical protein
VCDATRVGTEAGALEREPDEWSIAHGRVRPTRGGIRRRKRLAVRHWTYGVVSIKSIGGPRSRRAPGIRRELPRSTCSRRPTGSSVSAAFVQR